MEDYGESICRLLEKILIELEKINDNKLQQ